MNATQLRVTSALITWTTTQPGTTEVEYGPGGYGTSAWKDPRLTTSHSVHLSGLTPNTLYHYRVKSVGTTTVQSADRTFTTAAVPGGSTRYTASQGFSTTQGTNQWTYRDSVTGLMPTLLTSGQVVTDFGPTWQCCETYALLWKDGGHPGAARDVVRRWTAPSDGTVEISGVAHTFASAFTDGVRVQVKQGSTILYERLFGPDDWSTAGWFLTAVPVTTGSTLDFVINRGGSTHSNDATFFDPTIVFTPTAPPPSGLSNIAASELRLTSARLTWNTTGPANTGAEYNEVGGPTLTARADPLLRTSHSMYLGGLKPATAYQYRVMSTDATGITSISSVATFTTPAVPAGSTLYGASLDFATTQPFRQWSYRESGGVVMTTVLTSGLIFDFHGPTWQGSEAFVALWSDGGHPGQAVDAVRRWTSPGAGTVDIAAIAHGIHPDETDGVLLTVRKNGSLLATKLFASNDWATDVVLASAPVQAGDTIEFVHNKYGDNNFNDSAYFNPAIVFTPTTPDGNPPIITNLVPTPRVTSAAITWTTNELATSELEYGLSPSYGQTGWNDLRLSTAHGILLPNLTPGVTYYFRVRSTDAAGNAQTSTGQFLMPQLGGQTLYAADDDFSLTQGFRQWTYRDAAAVWTSTITSGPIFQFNGPTWMGSESFALLWANGGHPGAVSDAIRRWTAPQAGQARIEGVAYLLHPDDPVTDGVRIRVLVNGVERGNTLIAPGDWTTYGFDFTVTVAAGDTVDFVINKGGANNNGDAIFYTPAILLGP